MVTSLYSSYSTREVHLDRSYDMDKVLDHDTSNFETNATVAQAKGQHKLRPSLVPYGFTGRTIPESVKDYSVQTTLQARHDEQIGLNKGTSYISVGDLAKHLAWTWIPGRDRKVCPPLVDLRDARLLVLDRFSVEPGALPSRIGLTMFKSYINPDASVVHASPQSVLKFNDLSLRPFSGARKLILDADNVEVFETGLDLDQAVRHATAGDLPLVDTFTPPEVLFAFPENYKPVASRNAAMLNKIRQSFHPDASPLQSFVSPGMYINSVSSTRGKTTVSYNTGREVKLMYLPDWLEVEGCVKQGETLPKGVVFADLPRNDFSESEMRDTLNSLSDYDRAWLEDCVLEDETEFHNIVEDHENRQPRLDLAPRPRSLAYRFRCVPGKYVPEQMHMVRRIYLDFRPLLGRSQPIYEDGRLQYYDTNDHQVAINVMRFPEQPTIEECTFGLQADGEPPVWSANLLETHNLAPWRDFVAYRGRATE